jgi:hypothetical protein
MVGGDYGHTALQVSQQSAKSIMCMNQVGLMLLDGTFECGQTAQISYDAFALHTKENHITSLQLQSTSLLLYEWCKMPRFIISYD